MKKILHTAFKIAAVANKYIAILWNGKCNICIDVIIPKNEIKGTANLAFP